MVRRPVDGHLAHPVVVGIVLVGVGVEPAVAQSEGPVAEAVAETEVHAQCTGVIHVLILPGTDGIVLDDIFGRRLVVGDGHQRDHILDPVVIARDVDAESRERVFPAQREIVAGLRAQSLVAQVEISAAHLLDVAVVQFLGSRGLEALAPGGADAPRQPERQHRGDLGRDFDAELAVPGQSRAAGQLDPVVAEIALPFILGIDRGRPVADGAAYHAVGRIEPVVAVLHAGVEEIVGGQREDAFQAGHRAALVALHLGLVGQIRVIRVVEGTLALLVVLHQRSGGEVIHIGVPVPVEVESHDVGLVGLPAEAGRGRSVAVLQVVGVDVELGIFAVGTVDAFAVEGSAGIELQFVGGGEGELLADLRVGVPVHGLVLRIGHGRLRARGVLHGGVLPAVGMLELEVGQRAEAAVFQADGVVLAQVPIRAATRAVLQQQAFLAVLARDDVDHAGDGVAAVEGGGSALDNLDLFDVARIDQRQVVFAAHVAVDALAVDQDQDIAVAQAVELHMGAHVVFVEGERGGQAAQDVFERASGIVLQHLARDDFRLHGYVLEQMLRAGGRDDGLRNRVLEIRLRCQ